MKFTISGAAVVSVLYAANPVFAAWKGFNLGANKADGSCKGVADYTADFQKIQSWPGGFNAVRLYSAADCNSKYSLIRKSPSFVPMEKDFL